MLFNSLRFMIFFPIVLLVYFCIPDRWKNYWLLLNSYYFYMCWNARYALLIFISTVITYWSGLALEYVKHKGQCKVNQSSLKKGIVFISVASNLGILFYFKYFNFLLDLLNRAFLTCHIRLNLPQYDILLPVGISFYTFQALSYTIDVYRDDIYAERNFFRYALFVSFFPQLVAGPIERSKNLLRQLAVPTRFDFTRFREGLLLMLWGYFLKLVLADRIAVFVDAVYGNVQEYVGFYAIVATMLFAIQIYCDFAGYSTIAMGTAKILGIHLMENFHAPYLTCSVAEFWRNWHISLTSWFKDYLYIPLGGSRKGTIRKYWNKMIVFLTSGLWHGAQLTYVVWGGINGLYQILGEMLLPMRDALVKKFCLNRNSFGHRLVTMVGTFALVDFTWIFFRVPSLKDALRMIKSMVTVWNPWVLFDGSLYQCGLDEKNFRLMILSIGILLFADCCKKRGIIIRERILAQDYWFRWLVFSLSSVAILLFGVWGPEYNQANFIYFQF